MGSKFLLRDEFNSDIVRRGCYDLLNKDARTSIVHIERLRRERGDSGGRVEVVKEIEAINV